MSSTRLARPTLVAIALVCACVHKEDLSDPEALMSGSESGSSTSTSGDDGASSVSATSTTGEDACAGSDGTRTSLQVYSGSVEDSTLSGIEDVAFTPAGDVGLAFVQGNHEWAVVNADGTIAFDDAPGTLAHVGVVRALQSGGWAVANSALFDPADWVQVVAADGTVTYNGEWVVDEQANYIIDQLVAFADGSTLAQISWYDLESHRGLIAHHDATGTLVETIDVTDATRGMMVGDGDGTVWALAVVGNDTHIQRYDAGAYDVAAQTMVASGRWGQRLAIDSQGRPVLGGQDPERNGSSPDPLFFVDVFDPVSGTLAQSWDTDATTGLGYVSDVATGPCGEIFAVGASNGQGWVARLGDEGVAWGDQLDVEGALRVGVAADGTVIAVGQTTVPDLDPITIGPWVARYAP